MSRPVYSKRLFVEEGLNTNLGYTVPAGYVAVLRDVDVFCNLYSTSTEFYVAGVGGAILWYVTVGALTDPSFYQWRGRQVFNAGDIITFAGSSNGVDMTASGYLLSTP